MVFCVDVAGVVVDHVLHGGLLLRFSGVRHPLLLHLGSLQISGTTETHSDNHLFPGKLFSKYFSWLRFVGTLGSTLIKCIQTNIFRLPFINNQIKWFITKFLFFLYLNFQFSIKFFLFSFANFFRAFFLYFPGDQNDH